MDILEDEDQRDLGAERLDELRHLAQHALAGGAEQIAPEPVAVLLVDEPGELREPGRGVAAQQRPGRSVFAHQPPDGLQHGHVGFRGAELLQALAARDGEGVTLRCASDEMLDERRLACAGFAGDEHHLPLTAQRPREPLLEKLDLAAATDEPHGGLGSWRSARRPGE